VEELMLAAAGVTAVGASVAFGMARVKRRRPLALTPADLVVLARVTLDVQARCIEGFTNAKAKGVQQRHQLFQQYLVSYQVKALPNGVEHVLSVGLEGSLGRLGASSERAVQVDLLKLLAYTVRLARLHTPSPFEAQGVRLQVTRVLTEEQTKKAGRAATETPSETLAATFFTAASLDAEALTSQLG
jgi:triphosphoribosyl-dephospho-CoA synthetase